MPHNDHEMASGYVAPVADATTKPRLGDVLVAIPVLNEVARIGKVYDQLLIDLPVDRNIRILVLDGGSSDGTQAKVQEIAASDARVELVANPKRLQSAAINLAATLAKPSEVYLIRADAHTDYPPGFLASVVAELDRPDVDSVVVPMDSRGTTCTGRATAWVSDTILGSGGSAHRGGTHSQFVDHGHHAGWDLEKFQHVGGYDESFSHNEDAELDCRTNRVGGKIWLDADIRLIYYVRPTLGALFRQYRNYGRGRSRTVRRHPGSMRLRQLLVPSATVFNGLAILLSPFLIWTLIVPGLYLMLLAAVSVQVALQKRSICGLLAGPAAIVMHVAWAIGFLGGMLTIRESAWQLQSSRDDSLKSSNADSGPGPVRNLIGAGSS